MTTTVSVNIVITQLEQSTLVNKSLNYYYHYLWGNCDHNLAFKWLRPVWQT